MSISDAKETTYRFGDIAGEPCTMLKPIQGFKEKPLVSLEQATESFNATMPLLSTMVHVVKERAQNPANKLSVDESAAIALYTMEWQPYTESLYYILNNALRTVDRAILKPWFLYLKLILTALSRLPSIQNTVYRGIKCQNENEHEKYRTGCDIVWWGFSSCSVSKEISEKEQFLGQTGRRILFVINCIKGKDIGNHSYFKIESEVLLLPATKFKVIKCEDGGDGLYVIHLEEIESSHVLLEPVSTEEELKLFQNNLASPNKVLQPKPIAIASERHVNVKLMEYIARYKLRSDVYLNGKHYNEHDMEVIAQQLIVNGQCPGLFLSESGLTSREAIAIFDALHNTNNTLERLFLSHNKLGDEGTKVVAMALSNNTNLKLKELCLCDNGITDKGVEHLAVMLESNRTLTHLMLSLNKIGEQGLQRLADALFKNKNNTLRLLSLERNTFPSDACVNILLRMLESNQSLTSLNLGNCKLPRTAKKLLKGAVAKKRNFELIIH
jgi:hypothetical protein